MNSLCSLTCEMGSHGPDHQAGLKEADLGKSRRFTKPSAVESSRESNQTGQYQATGRWTCLPSALEGCSAI